MSRTATLSAKSTKIVASAIDATTAPITPATVPAAPASLSTCKAEVQAQAIIDALKGAYLKTAVGALQDSAGKSDVAATLVSPAVLPTLHLIARIVPILRNSAPAALFTDGNNRGARVGELFASRLGLSALYRDTTRADLKSARAALVESAK